MSGPRTENTSPGASPDSSADERQPLALDRQLFHLKTLFEAARDLSTPDNPADILKVFLPIAMGPLGLTFGFGVMLRSDDIHVASLGLEASVKKKYEQTGTELVSKFFPDREIVLTTPRPVVLVGHHLSSDPNLPVGTNAVIAIPIDKCSYTVLGFGPKISDEPYGEDEIELLQGLASNLSAVLKKACAEEHIHGLNADLREKNTQMKEALELAENAREGLNRHAFQLQTLYETTLELSSITDPKVILNTFALTLMGTFSYSCGWIVLYGPGDADVAYRGSDPNGQVSLTSDEGREKVLTRFVELKDRMPHSNQSYLLEDKEGISNLPANADLAVLFSLDHEWRGAIGLGDSLSDASMTEEMKRLLLSLVGTFTVTLGNAKQIQLIRNLNKDLAARNIELQTTLDQLTSAKQEINIQTEAKERIIGLVHGEVARVWRASWLDVGLIILAGIVLGVLFNLSSPSGIKLIPQSLLEPAPAMVDVSKANYWTRNDDVVIIDARPAEFYKQGHIPNAMNIPKDLFNFIYSMKLANLDPEKLLLVYGRTISRHYDSDVARELELMGHEHVIVIDGGLSAWEDAGYEVAQ